jgi:hypothetical protein
MLWIFCSLGRNGQKGAEVIERNRQKKGNEAENCAGDGAARARAQGAAN